MIVFLTLCYVGVLALLVKSGLIRLNLWWKLSPLVWLLLLLGVLFVPMQWGAPSGNVTQYQFVTQVTPNVAGTVISVDATVNRPTRKGEELFRIDPTPYQYQVDQARAALAEAEQAVPQLKAAWNAAAAATVRAEVARDLAKSEYDIAEKTRSSDAGAISKLRVLKEQQGLKSADAVLTQARANEEQARLRYQSNIDGSNTTVAQRRSQLATAEYNLAQTRVTAPDDGVPLAVSLRPGQRVGTVRGGSALAYALDGETQLILWIPQTYARHVRPGQEAEVVFQLYPGRTLPATVNSMTRMNAAGEILPSARLPSPPSGPAAAGQYAVLLDMDPTSLPEGGIPGAALGVAAIYTESAKPTQLIRRVMLRMQAWLYYLTA